MTFCPKSVLNILKTNGYVKYPDKLNAINPDGTFDKMCSVFLKVDESYKKIEVVFYDTENDKVFQYYTFDVTEINMMKYLVDYWDYMT